MSLFSSENLFLAILWIVAGFVIVFASILVMHFLLPKPVLETYFKPPYFQPGECDVLKGIPYSPIRTVIFMSVFAFPGMAKKRQLTRAYELAPAWYRLVSKIIIVALIVLTVVTLCLGAAYYIYRLLQ